ncbi:hypothetical protein PYCC9005_004198 [Savitreella phatthalungensis]
MRRARLGSQFSTKAESKADGNAISRRLAELEGSAADSHDDALSRMRFDTNRLTYAGTSRTPIRQTSPSNAARLDRKVAERLRIAQAHAETNSYRAATERSKEFAAAEEKFRPMPDTLEGLQSLAEERIEEARRNGAFRNLEGKGKALDLAEARQPMVDRTEYFLNQIIKKQGALPPFVDAQVNLDKAVADFRRCLRLEWASFACKVIAMAGGSLEDQVARARRYGTAEITRVDRLRDTNWERREWPFIKARVKDLNDKVRGYNIIAPFNSRRVYLAAREELDAAYREATPMVAGQLIDRANAPKFKESRVYSARYGRTSILDHLAGRAKSTFYERDIGTYGFSEWWKDTFRRSA